MKKALRKLAHDVGLTEHEDQTIRSIFGFGKTAAPAGAPRPEHPIPGPQGLDVVAAADLPMEPDSGQSAPAPTVAVGGELSAPPTSGARAAQAAAAEQIAEHADEEPVPIWWPPEGAGAVFTDAVAPIIVAAMSGRSLRRVPLSTADERMIAGATVAPGFTGGSLHVWGSGAAGSKETRMKTPVGFTRLDNLEVAVYATRGPFSANMFNAVGIEAPAVYGDPIWFAPKVLSFEDVPKDIELGVVPPPSSDPSGASTLKTRYEIPTSLRGTVELIDLSCDGSMASLQAKAFDIARCKRIITAAPHLVPLAEALNLPVAVFGVIGRGAKRVRVDDDEVLFPARARDAYAGMGAETALVYRQPFDEETDWEAVIGSVDQMWRPVRFDPAPLFDAFPTDVVVPFESPRWPVERRGATASRRRSAA